MHRRQPKSTLAALAPLAWAALTVSGCGGDWKADTVPTTGRVTVNGQAPTGLLVQLYPTGPAVDARNSRPWGKVGPDGTYNLAAYEDRDGVPPGDYAVTLIWPVDASVMGSPDQLSHRYDRPVQSPWKVSVRPGEANTLPPIELTGIKLPANPQTPKRDQAVFSH